MLWRSSLGASGEEKADTGPMLLYRWSIEFGERAASKEVKRCWFELTSSKTVDSYKMARLRASKSDWEYRHNFSLSSSLCAVVQVRVK